jgi:hypothetical protein
VPNQLLQVSDLSGLSYIGSAAHGTDKILVRAFNGAWSSWTEADITDQGNSAHVIGAGATMELAGSYSGQVTFAAAAGTLKIDHSSSFSGKIGGQLAIGDVIDLVDITAGASAKISYSGNNSPGTLTVSDGTHTASIALLGNYSLASFTASSDGNGGTSVVDPPLAGGIGLYVAADPAGSQSGLNQQVALFRQSLASFAPSEGSGESPTSPALAIDSSLLSSMAPPVPNQQHA